MSRLKQEITGCSVRFECEDLDAGLPMHAHPPGPMEHDVHCTHGAVLVWVYPDQCFVVRAGETLMTDTTRWHGVVPLTAGAAFVNTGNTDNGTSSTVLESPHDAPAWVLERRADYLKG